MRCLSRDESKDYVVLASKNYVRKHRLPCWQTGGSSPGDLAVRGPLVHGFKDAFCMDSRNLGFKESIDPGGM
jgi:hypothetical protein